MHDAASPAPPVSAGPSTPPSLTALLRVLLREALTNVGGGATAASLQEHLHARGLLSRADFQLCHAASRLTPGTTVIALAAALGAVCRGWRGALAAVVVSTLPAAGCAVLLGVIYTAWSTSPLLRHALEGAAVAASAVLAWAAVTLLRPAFSAHAVRAFAVLVVVLLAATTTPLPPLVLLLGGAAAGALWLR